MSRDDERQARAQEEPIVGGLPDVPGIGTAIRLTPGLGVHLRGQFLMTRAAQKYVDKGKLAVVVVGKAADFDRPLSSFGPVTTIDVTIPPP